MSDEPAEHGLSSETKLLVGLLQEKVIRPFNIPKKDDLSDVEPFLLDVYTGFYSSIESCISLAAIIYDICAQFERESHFRRHHASERILQMAGAVRAGDLGGSLTDAMEQAALLNAVRRTDDYVSDGDKWISAVGGRIFHLVDKLKFANQADNLTRQSLVLIWTTFESFCREIFRSMLNSKPNLYRRLLKDSDFRKEVQAINVETLEDRNFDISNALGDILVMRRDMTSSKAIERIFTALYPNSKRLSIALKSRELYRLGRIRNLIVHNGGTVDAEFCRCTDYKGSLGTLIRFDTVDFERYICCVLESASSIVQEVANDFVKQE